MGSPEPPPLPGKGRRRKTDVNRVRANREIGRAYRALTAVRTFFWVLLVVNVGIALFLTANEHRGDDRTMNYVLSGVFLVLALVFLVGALRMQKEPLVWSVVGTVFQTIVAVWTFSVLYAVLAAGCWAAFLVIKPAAALMKQYPDLRIARKMRGGRGG